jgi:hypothetical protein
VLIDTDPLVAVFPNGMMEAVVKNYRSLTQKKGPEVKTWLSDER